MFDWARICGECPVSLPEPLLDVQGVIDYVDSVWPDAAGAYAEGLQIVRPGFVRFTRQTKTDNLRPGGSVSGPTMMEAVDQASYALVIAHLGGAALAVTSHLSIEFLRRPGLGTLITDVEMLKLGRTQLTMSARLYVDDPESPPVAAATTVYSRALVPPAEAAQV